MTSFPWLSTIIFLPIIGGLVVLALWRHPLQCRWVSLGITLADLGLTIGLLFLEFKAYVGATLGWLMFEDYPWIRHFGIRFSLGLDGMSLVLILLTTFLGVICVLVSWRQIETRVSSFHFFLLAMQTGVLGVFLATDLFLFYLFWELQLIPMFFIIGIWGHEERVYATVKFVMFSIAGSLILLIAVIAIYFAYGAQSGTYSFSLFRLIDTTVARKEEVWLYAAFVLAFAIKIPLFPVHTWLPDAHTQAPTAGSVILAALLLKTGVYAMLRWAIPLFPTSAKLSVPLLLAVGLIGIFYAAWLALAQKDMKRLVAYSSISHMGLILIGVMVWNQITLAGVMMQMLNHGLTTAALFIMVGMLDERTHTRELSAFGGLWKRMPIFSAFFLLFCMASVGLPGLNNFVGEILILVGTFRQQPVVGAIGFVGIVFVLVYVLRLVQDSLFGEGKEEGLLRDVDAREAVVLVPLAIAVLWIGLYPAPILKLLQGSLLGMMQHVGRIMTR